MRVLSVASELYPLVKTGGLGDVAAALPVALRALDNVDVDARVLLPGYGPVLDALRIAHTVFEVPDLFQGGRARVLAGYLEGVAAPAYVLDCPGHYIREGGPYAGADGVDHPDNHRRFAALGWVAAELAAGADHAFVPEVLHCHDWQAGLAPAYVRARGLPTRTVMTIHNLAYQGHFGPEIFEELKLPPSAFQVYGVEYHGGVSFLKAGIFYADRVTTVSRTYAREIQTPDAGFGLDGLLSARKEHLTGIVNGVDYEVWSPGKDPHLGRRYGISDVREGKAEARGDLEKRVGLTPRPGAPLFGVVARLAWLKGLDLLLDAAHAIVDRGGQLMVLGSGQPKLEDGFRALALAHPGQVATVIGYDEHLAHLIQAASDVILVPSRSEPCGLTQLYALRYGALPLVRNTGGLTDTVVNATENEVATGRATGFVFDMATPEALAGTIHWVIDLFEHAEGTWRTMQRTAMTRDFGWGRAARQYLAVYREVLAEER